jgi:hypothetical protein
MACLGPHLRPGSKRNVVEYRLHQGAIKGSARVDRRDNSTRRVDEGTESRIAAGRGIELKTAIDIRVDTGKRRSVTPGEDSRFEFA